MRGAREVMVLLPADTVYAAALLAAAAALDRNAMSSTEPRRCARPSSPRDAAESDRAAGAAPVT